MVIEFLAEGFEEIEALTPVDILRRAGVEIKTCGITGKCVRGSHSIPVTADMTADELPDYSEIEMIILPGGMPGARNLDESAVVEDYLKKCSENGSYIAAICAAPMVPGKRGMFEGRRAVCYPGYEKYLAGAVLTGGRVEVDGKMITGCGMGAAEEFALALCTVLKGEETAEKIRCGILGR